MGRSLIHERYEATRATLPRVELLDTPTPVRELARLSEAAAGGHPLWLKDDSLSAPLWGGNKPRKLEWVIGDAKARDFRTILTFGGLGTNHGLATALYAGEHGLQTVLALVDQPRDDHVDRQLARIRASGAAVHLTHTKARTLLSLPYLTARYSQARPPRPPYLLGPGGSSPMGALGFVEAALELADQVDRGELPEPETVLVALGSGGSAAGLLAGLRMAGLRTRVRPVLVNDGLDLSEKKLYGLAGKALGLLESRGADVGGVNLRAGDLEVVHGFLGDGYGHSTPEGEAALALGSDCEGLELEPVYTAKTLAALLAGVGRGDFGSGPVLFWNTHSAVPV